MTRPKADVRPRLAAAAVRLADAVLKQGLRGDRNGMSEARCRICGCVIEKPTDHTKFCEFYAYSKVRKLP